MSYSRKVARMDEIIQDIGYLLDRCKDVDLRHKELERKYTELSYAYSLCAQTIEYMTKQNEDNLNTISRLQKQIEVIEDDKRQLTKVSNIIAIERENSRLKFELDVLKKRLEKPVVPLPEPVVVPLPEPVVPLPEPVLVPLPEPVVAPATDQNETEQDLNDSDIEVYEKKIKNDIYYVSTQEDNSVYVKEADGSIGEKVGVLQKVNGKTKVVWL